MCRQGLEGVARYECVIYRKFHHEEKKQNAGF